jgi:hypothetical protein
LFNPTYAGSAVIETSAQQTRYAPNLAFPPGGVQITGPADVTNATQIYVQFLSDSLGNTNLSDATGSTGFVLAGGGVTSMAGIIDAPPIGNASNLYYPAIGNLEDNSAWLLVNLNPGTNATTVTNHLRLYAINGNNNRSTGT